MKYLFYLVSIVSLISCGMSKHDADFVLTSLKTKYDKDFEILSTKYIRAIGKNRAKVVSSDNPDLSFIVEYKKDASLFQDYYVQALHKAQAADFVKQYWSTIDFPMVSNAVGRYNKAVDPKNIPTYESLINSDPANVVLVATIYLFVNSMDEVFPEIIRFDKKLRSIGFKKAGMEIVAYDKKRVDSDNLSQYKFGFKNLVDDTFEWKYEDAGLGRINYYLNKDNPASPTIEDLKAIVLDYAGALKFSVL